MTSIFDKRLKWWETEFFKSLPEKPDYSDKAVRPAAADLATQIESVIIRPQVEALFKRFKLDPQNPFNWMWLVVAFAHAMTETKRGAKTKWNESTLIQLLIDFSEERARTSSGRKRSEHEICIALSKRAAYVKLDPKTIQRHLLRARQIPESRIIQTQDPVMKAIQLSMSQKFRP